MSKIPSQSNPYREGYSELQRVVASNRFIFTHGCIWFAIGFVLGPIPLVVYAALGAGFIFLALAFEKPYQLLRRLLPYGNWSPHLAALPTRTKIFSIIMAVFVTFSIGVMPFVLDRWIFPWILPSGSEDCWGSLACLLWRYTLR